ncbi:MAG: ATP-binding cassette domain-containing protein [Alicyclobacillus sp.]|nr:ATP-binding cassette domain-containing protein [Alicyclobacillus sp.]
MSLNVNRLCKAYGDKVAIKDLSFTVEQGQVFGLLGLNGAGKSTTIRIILNILKADSGTVTWKGRPSFEQVTKHFGYLPEERGLYQQMKVLDQLVLFGRLHGMSRADALAASMKWLERFEIPSYRDKTIAELSKGNQQKIQFIAAILHHPEVMILDEPFSGLDPVNASLFKSVIRELTKAGHTILFSSHQLENVEELSHAVGIIHQSQMVLFGTVRELLAAQPPTYLRIGTNLEVLRRLVDVKIQEEERTGTFLVPVKGINPSELLRQLMNADADVRHFELVRPTLADIFLQKVGRTA